MIVNKSMFPLQTSFGVISKMQDQFADLQIQLGTGEKASTLAGMGRDLPLSLSVRSRLDKIEGFSGNIDTVNLRLSFLDKTLSRFDEIEGEGRNSAMQGQYGTNNINMATLPSLSEARLDELVTMLNLDVAGRYLFGGANTDSAPLPTTDVLLNGQGGKAGFKAIVTERNAADAGMDGRGRLETRRDAVLTPTKVTLAEDGAHPFGFKVSTVSTNSGAVTITPQPEPVPQPIVGGPFLGNQVSFDFTALPDQIRSGETITLGLSLPDGTETSITMRAVTAEDATGAKGEFLIGETPEETALDFQLKLGERLEQVGETELTGASTFAAAQNFFNGAGEPVLRVSGTPAATAGALRVATSSDTIMWYSGESPAVSADNLGRLDVAAAGTAVSLKQHQPVSAAHGFTIAAISPSAGTITTSGPTGIDNAIGVQFDPDTLATAGDTVEITLTEPSRNGADPVVRKVVLTAVDSRPGPGQFRIGLDPTETAKNFGDALNAAVTAAAKQAEGNPRQSVTAQVDDVTRVSYGMEASETGFLRLMRTMASMSVVSYPAGDETDRGRFDAMARRQQLELSEGRNSERGSIEIIAMELGVAHGTLKSSTERHTNYKAQLDNLLSDVETINKEEVAMQLMDLQTRLQASYQATSMVSKLSLVNYL